MRTKRLKIQDYPTTTNFSLEAHIKKIVNREAEMMADIPAPQLPKYEKPTKMKWSVGLANFFKHNVTQIIP